MYRGRLIVLPLITSSYIIGTGVVSSAKEIIKMSDEMVDKIDDLLGEQAEEFIKSYRQKGGE